MRTLVDFEEVEREHPSWSNAVYTTSVILWMLVYQRLNPDRSLEAAVKQLIENPPDFLPDNVRVTEGTLSTNSGAYRRSRTRLHAVQIHNDLTLSLVSDLPDSAQTLADLDEGRTDIQIDLRNQKVVLDTEHIRARSRAMFTKENMTSLVAYHLVIQFRRQAAALVKRPPRGLSFKRTWTTFRTFLPLVHDQRRGPLPPALPPRPVPRPKRQAPEPFRRHCERETFKKRAKFTHFKTRPPPVEVK